MNRFLTGLLACVSLSAGLLACSDPEESDATDLDVATDPQPPCELTVGWDPWEPYQYMNAAGEVTGLDIAVARAVARQADCELEFHRDSWVALLSDIESGEIDVVAGATHTPAREDTAWFTVPYRSESFVLYVRSEDTDACAAADSLADLLEAGMRVGTVEDYYYGDVVADLQANPEFEGQVVDSAVSEANLDLLLDQEIDAFVEDPFVAASAIRKRGLSEQIAECAIELNSGDVNFMLGRAGVHAATFKRFDKALRELKQSGELQDIVQRYRNPLGASSSEGSNGSD